jgi:hypothetical protein
MNPEMNQLLDESKYNLNDPKEFERYFLALQSELLEVVGKISGGYQDLYDKLLANDLHNLPNEVLKSFSEVFFALHKYSEACYNYYRVIVALKGVQAPLLD